RGAGLLFRAPGSCERNRFFARAAHTSPRVSEGPIFLSTLPAQRRDRRYAAAAVGASAAIFLIAVPFAKVPLTPVWAFIPIYESALVVNDLMTAILLFGQFTFLRSRALLLLATGYLF